MKKYLLFLLFALSNSFFAQKIQYKLQKSEVFRDDFKNTNIVLSEINEKKNFYWFAPTMEAQCFLKVKDIILRNIIVNFN